MSHVSRLNLTIHWLLCSSTRRKPLLVSCKLPPNLSTGQSSRVLEWNYSITVQRPTPLVTTLPNGRWIYIELKSESRSYPNGMSALKRNVPLRISPVFKRSRCSRSTFCQMQPNGIFTNRALRVLVVSSDGLRLYCNAEL